MTPVPPSRPHSSSHAQHAERNVRLDPQGIYGTRSARRQSQLRRRRQAQNAALWVVGIVALAALAKYALQPRHTALVTGRATQFPFRPASAPLVVGDGELIFTSQSGGLWRAKVGGNAELGAPRRVWSDAFAPAGPPLLTSTQIFWPGGDGVLAALDLKTGREAWRARLASALVARPALALVEGRALVMAGDDQGHIAAFDAQNGLLKWKKTLGGALGAGIGVLGAQNGVGAGILVPLVAGANSRGGLVCLDAKSGALRWSFPGDARSHAAGTALPAALGNRVFWCNDEGAVMCLDGQSGRKIWKSFAAPIDLAKGAASDELVMLRGAPTLVEAAGVVVVGGNDGALRAFDLATGKPCWSQNLGGAVRFGAQKLNFEGKTALLATGETAAIWLIDAQNGGVLKRWTTPHPNSYGATFTSGHVYGLDREGHLQVATLD